MVQFGKSSTPLLPVAGQTTADGCCIFTFFMYLKSISISFKLYLSTKEQAAECIYQDKSHTKWEEKKERTHAYV